MADKIYVKARCGLREDTLENWRASNPVLERGEPVVVRDGENGEWLKIGDGETAFNDLPYKKGPAGDKGEQGENAGQFTEAGGEIINDYENNTAGLKGFNVSSAVQTDLTVAFALDSVVGIEVGDVVSVQLSACYDYIGAVTDITDLTVTVGLYDTGLSIPDKTGTLWIPAKAYIGTAQLGEYSFAANLNNKASAESAAAFGKNNIAGGKRALVSGADNFSGFCCVVGGQKNKARGVRGAAFGYNNDIATTSEYGFVANANNKVRSNGSAGFGSGNEEGAKASMGANLIAGIQNDIEDGSWGALLVSGYKNTAQTGSARSVITGQGNIVGGGQHIVGGVNNTVTGTSHIVGGIENILGGKYNLIAGYYNTISDSSEGSLVLGYRNSLSGDGFILGGDNNTVCASLGLVLGSENKVYGSTHFIQGYQNTVCEDGEADQKQFCYVNGQNNYIKGKHNYIMGSNNRIDGFRNCAMYGSFLRAATNNQVLYGIANEKDPDALLIVANGEGHADGEDYYNKKNAFVVKADGSARIQTESTEDDAVVRYSLLKTLIEDFEAYKSETDERIEYLESRILALESGV